MKKLLYFSLLSFCYNVLLLILPMVVFLISLSLTQVLIIDAFLWIYFIFLLASPIFTLILAYKIAMAYHDQSRYLSPFIISFLGFIPLWVLSFSFSTFWSLLDYLYITSVPLLTGMLALMLVSMTPAPR